MSVERPVEPPVKDDAGPRALEALRQGGDGLGEARDLTQDDVSHSGLWLGPAILAAVVLWIVVIWAITRAVTA